MALAVDQLSLGQIGTNCYLVRADRGATEAVVIDPGADAAEIRLALAAYGRDAAPAILLTHSHFDHFGGARRPRGGNGRARLACPRASSTSSAVRTTSSPAIPTRAYTATRRSCPAARRSTAAGISFEVVTFRATRPAMSPTTRTARSSPATCSSPARSAAPTSPFGDWDTLLESIRIARRAPTRPRRSSTRARSGDDARRRARAQSVPRRAPRVTSKLERPRGHARHPSVRAAALAAGDRARWSGSARSTATGRIQTPVFEDTELFARTSGAGSDVVQKEMYTFTDRGDRSLTLRPEGTAPICRAYVEHGMHREPQPQKLYTIAPMYRYGAPRQGRYREHWQLVGRGDRHRTTRRSTPRSSSSTTRCLRRLGVTTLPAAS